MRYPSIPPPLINIFYTKSFFFFCWKNGGRREARATKIECVEAVSGLSKWQSESDFIGHGHNFNTADAAIPNQLVHFGVVCEL